MTDTNANTLRNALAAAIKNHVTTNGLKAKDAAEIAGVQYSRLSTILRGDVSKVSADALVNILGGFGYRVTGIVGSGDGTEIVLSLDKAEGQVLPEIEAPTAAYSINVTEDEGGAIKADGFTVVNANEADGPFEYREGNAVLKDDGVHVNGVHVMGAIASDDADPDADRVVADDE